MEELNITQVSLQFSQDDDSKTDIEVNPHNFENIIIKQEIKPEIPDGDIKTTEWVNNEIEDVFDSKPQDFEIKQDDLELQETTDVLHIKGEETEGDTRNNISEQAYNSSDQTLSCNKCDYTTTKKKYMGRHMKVHNVSYDLTTKLKCKYCSFLTHVRSSLKQHSLTHLREEFFACEFCDYKTHNKRYLKYHTLRHYAKTLNCNLCSYKTSQKHLLNLHAKIHVPKKVFKCDQCDYETNTKVYFKNHMLVHSVDTLCVCDECGSECKGPNNLRKHKRNFHCKATPFLCDVCGYKVTKRRMFNVHMKTHTGEHCEKEPLQCEYCPYFTIRRDQLTKHMEVHAHEKFYHCDQCSYKTKIITDLVPHMKTHLNA